MRAKQLLWVALVPPQLELALPLPPPWLSVGSPRGLSSEPHSGTFSGRRGRSGPKKRRTPGRKPSSKPGGPSRPDSGVA